MNDIDLLKTALHFSDSLLIGNCLRDSRGQINDLEILLVNDQAVELMKQLRGESISVAVGDRLRANVSSALWEQIINVIATGNSRTVDSQFVFASGESRWFSVTMHRYTDGICLSFHDITVGRQTEQGLQRTIDELQRSNQNLEQFAYVASHDLQEPLRKLIGFGDILQSQYGSGLGEQGVRLVQRMQSATQRMHVLIRDLLGFSRVTSSREPFSRINLRDVVNEVLSDLEPVIRDKKAVLDITSLPYLEGDAGQLRQLFQNLLSNALKFTRPGEMPLVRVDCEVITGSAIEPMPGTTVLATDLNRQFFAITVSDNGVGFDEKYLDRIFTIFQRLHNRTDYPGTGIGLAVVQRAVENHKGYLSAHSQPGKGADFTVYLPDEPAQPKLVFSS